MLFFFRLFPIRGRYSAKVFFIELGLLRISPLLQPSPCLLSPNLSIFSLVFLSFFYQVLLSLSFFSQRNLLSSLRVHTYLTLFPEVCLPALQFLPSLLHTRFHRCHKSLISEANFFISGLAVQLMFKAVGGLVIEANFFSQFANSLE